MYYVCFLPTEKNSYLNWRNCANNGWMIEGEGFPKYWGSKVSFANVGNCVFNNASLNNDKCNVGWGVWIVVNQVWHRFSVPKTLKHET